MDGGQAYPKWGGWTGVKESSSTLGDVVRCLNVTFEDGVIARRPGRRVICATVPGMIVSRIFEHVTLSGSRSVLVGLLSADPAVAPRLGLFPPSGGAYVDLAMPAAYRRASPESFFWSSSYKGGHTIISDPTGRLLDYDGETVTELVALQGTDAAQDLAASRAYLAAPPPADVIAMWRNRIIAAHLRTLGISADPNDMTVPPEAPASGANVWPASTNLDVLTQEGDEIVGLAVQADRLACFLRRGVVVVDEDQVSPIPRIQEKQYGCVAPRSVQEVGGGLILYLSDGVVCQFDGARSSPISGDIRHTLSQVAWTKAHLAVSAHLARKTEYRLWLPLKGRTGNRVCVIYNYAQRTWRVYAGEFIFDRTGRYTQPFDVTAAATTILPTGEEILLTGDSQGRIWREDVGDDDGPTIIPAFAALAPIGDGESVMKFADMRVEAVFDGSWLAAIFAEHGNCLEQEITRYLDGEPTKGMSETVRLLQEDATGSLQTYDLTPKWGDDHHTAEKRSKRLSNRAISRRLQPIFLFPAWVGNVPVSEPGGISLVELALAPAGGRRG